MTGTKTIEEYFRDWEGNTFGFGYGSGEPHTIPAVKRFLEKCPNEGTYQHEVLEDDLTPAVAWLLINALCKADILEYGTSPRYGWLTSKGKRLRDFVCAHTDEELIEIACDHDENYIHCYPNACNCGPKGYEEGLVCQNPFWLDIATKK